MVTFNYWPRSNVCPVCNIPIFDSDKIGIFIASDERILKVKRNIGAGTVEFDPGQAVIVTTHGGCYDAALTIDYKRLLMALRKAADEIPDF